MSAYDTFRVKNIAEVTAILTEFEHDSILNWIIELDGAFTLKKPIDKISQLPTYRFAIACTLAALGNSIIANIIYGQPEQITQDDFGDNISRNLYSRLKN